MENAKEVSRAFLTGERALFHAENLHITDTIFDDGESPLKESSHIELEGSMFKWKYPLWYCNHITVKDCQWFEMARAGVWYTNDISVENALIQAPKNFRRCRGLELNNVYFANAAETLWSCEQVELKDGVKNMEIRNSTLLSKDAFWNSENVTVYDSFISGEYLGWNAKNLTLVNCTIESLQGLCYIDNLVMKNCKLINTTLAFEYSSGDADITGEVDSVMNPSSGRISAEAIKELIMEKDKIDPEKTQIIVRGK